MTTPGPWDRPPARQPVRVAAWCRRLPPGLFLWLGFLALVGLGLWGLSWYFPARQTAMDWLNAVNLVGFLALVSSGFLYGRRRRLKESARAVALWLAVGVVLVLGFAFRDQLLFLGQNLRSALVPGYPVQTGQREMIVTESAGGGYLVHGMVNGRPVPFLVDTGASDIVLSPADARRIGIPIDSLTFNHVYETANGEGRGAPYRLARLEVGPIVLHDVPVSINQAPMRTSLLGLTFLKRLKSFGFSDHKMILRW